MRIFDVFVLFNALSRIRNLIAAGAILMEWNVKQPSGVQAGAGMWDTHVRCVLLMLYNYIDNKIKWIVTFRLGGS